MITDVNEAPSVMVQDGTTPGGVEASSTVDENVAGAILGEIVIEDPDDGDMVTPSVTDDRFEVTQDDDGGWWLKLKDDASLNYEDSATVDVTVTVTDAAGLTAETVAMITVNDIGESPTAPMPRATELSVDENVAGDEVTVLDSSDPQGDAFTFQVNDSRFEVNDEGVLKLKDDVQLNHEAVSSIDLELTATDELGHVSSVTSVTVMVNDMNENPIAVGTVDNIAANAGREIDVSVDLTALFSDPDDGDAVVRWELSGNPSWLGLSVEYTTDDNGNDQVIGHLRGTPPTTGPESAAAHRVTLTASDVGGASGETTFHVVVDDLNDDVTGVNLLDDNGNSIVEVEVDENDASGVVLGEITVDDQDHPAHPNGMHLVTVNDDRFEIIVDDDGRKWLALRAGESLDHEKGEVEVTVTAVDMNGDQNSAVAQARGAPKYKGSSDSSTFTILVNDLNDAPKAGTIGNWWITVNDDWDAEQVNAGNLLNVSLETQGTTGDDFPAFTDQDLDAGDRLTYSISGASWIQIDERTGEITNVKGVLPGRGVYSVTVTATDSQGESASASFNVNVAHSDPVTVGGVTTLRGENEDPDANDARGSYRENSGEQVVATFTVSDLDQDIPDHEFAIKTVEIISIANDNDAADLDNVTLQDHDSNANTPNRLWTTGKTTNDAGYAAALRLSDPVKTGNTWTYQILARDTDPSARVNTLDLLNREEVEDILVTVRVTDGTGATETAVIAINIVDVNEAPVANFHHPATNPTGILTQAERTVNQSENNDTPAVDTDDPKIVLYINLEALWSDDRDDPDELIFGASSSVSWIDILYAPGEWEDIIKGPDGDTGGGDDLTWGTPGGSDVGRTIGAAPSGADDDLMVVIVEIDRTNRNTQGDEGSFTLTARDKNGATGTLEVPVVVTDENEPISQGAVTISGSAREGSTLRAHFNENRDPDLAGDESAVLVLYTWHTGSVAADGTFTSSGVIQRGTSDELSLTQSHVGSHIQVQVTYYEVFDGQFITTSDTDGQLNADGGQVSITATTERMVSNTPDDGVGHFTITVARDVLTASVVIDDEDVTGTDLTTPTYSWQMSANGVGGWRNVDQTGDSDTSTLELDDGEGRYYRAVATYDADGIDDTDVANADEEMDRVYSDPIRIGDVANAADSTAVPPTTDQTPAALSPTGSPFPGGTLSVSGRDVSSVQWQVNSAAAGGWVNIPGATGDLNVTGALAGATVRALVTYESTDPNNPGVTAVVIAADGNDLDDDTDTTENEITIGGSSASARPTPIDDDEITGTVMGSGHARRAADNTGDGVLSGLAVSITERVDLASLFQDPDTASARLTFSAVGDPASDNTGADLTTGSTSGGSYLFQGETGVLTLNVRSGELTYVSDQLRGHDGDNADGAGNVVTLNITANDSPIGATSGNSASTADVSIRINVAPTGIDFTADTTVTTAAASTSDIVSGDFALTGASTATGTALGGIYGPLPEVTLIEEVTSRGGEVLAKINVLDENFSGTSTRPGHPFGVHEVSVVGDDRFMITNTGNSILRDGDGDGSTWELRLVRGAEFDFETESDADGDPTNGKQIVLTLSATDRGGDSEGLSTPTPNAALGYSAIYLVVTIMNDTDDDRPPPGPTETPGLKDDETGDTDDTTDSGGDNETDGGDPTPPPPGMSLGGIIEDFIDNMDQGEQDLLEDYLLTIDDGLDIL